MGVGPMGRAGRHHWGNVAEVEPTHLSPHPYGGPFFAMGSQGSECDDSYSHVAEHVMLS